MQAMEELVEIVELQQSPEDAQYDWKKSVCPYCGVGCGVLAGVKDGRVQKIKGDPNHPANLGLLCAKGVTLPQMLHTDDRLLNPMLRAKRSDPFSTASWDNALDRIASTWKKIISESGPNSVAFYISGQLMTEDYFTVNKLAKAFLKTNNVDSNSRLCMASAVSGYVSSLGADAPPGCFADIELSSCFFLIGSNTYACHPVAYERIRRRKAKAGDRVKVIVADPRRTKTADIADVFLPLKPGTDVALMNGMLHVLIKEGMTDPEFIRDHTDGWDWLKTMTEKYTPEKTAEICGLDAKDIVSAARMFGNSPAAMSLWAMGLNQSVHGTAKNNAVINLHLATGNIGRPGAGPFSLTGQPNAMGGRETGGLAHLLPGHRFVAKEQDRKEAELLWGVPKGTIDAKPGLSAVELFQAIEEKKVRSVWVMATNPMVSMPNLQRTKRAFESAELVIVSDPYHPTETTMNADIILPAAQWSERDGTLTNSERAISYLEQATVAPGQSLPDWQIIAKFADAMGFGKDFPYRDASEIFSEYTRFTKGRDLDMSGINHKRLHEGGPLHWPCASEGHRATLRRYTNGKFAYASGRARFIAHEHEEPAEPTDKDFPLILTTGRVRDQWHTMTRTGKIPSLLKRDPEPFIELHPDDAKTHKVKDGEMIKVESRRGAAQAKAKITETIRAGTCFMPFHWGGLWANGNATVNTSTQEAYDPTSKQPELKHCAIKIARVTQ